MRDQRIVILGPGTAGCGIADSLREAMVGDGLDPEEATRRIWLVGRHGLLTQDLDVPFRDFQLPYVRPAGTGVRDFGETVAAAKPTMMIGTSTVPGAFTESVVRSMAAHVERPIILPMSNPTSRSEADPADLIPWTDGRALVATGSPFPPVDHAGMRYWIAQANNALVFPGLGLGVTVARARRVTDGLLMAAAQAVAGLTDATRRGAPLLPPVRELRRVSATVAVEVAKAAAVAGLSQAELPNVIQQVHEAMWQPDYPQIEAV